MCKNCAKAYLLNKACETVRCHNCNDLWVPSPGRMTGPAAAGRAPLGGGGLIAGGQTWPRQPHPRSLSRSYTANLFTLNVEKCPVASAEERSCENDKLIFTVCNTCFCNHLKNCPNLINNKMITRILQSPIYGYSSCNILWLNWD